MTYLVLLRWFGISNSSMTWGFWFFFLLAFFRGSRNNSNFYCSGLSFKSEGTRRRMEHFLQSTFWSIQLSSLPSSISPPWLLNCSFLYFFLFPLFFGNQVLKKVKDVIEVTFTKQCNPYKFDWGENFVMREYEELFKLAHLKLVCETWWCGKRWRRILLMRELWRKCASTTNTKCIQNFHKRCLIKFLVLTLSSILGSFQEWEKNF